MDDLLLTLSVIFMFLLRIGVPVLVLVTFGYLLDRWQSRHETDLEAYTPNDQLGSGD